MKALLIAIILSALPAPGQDRADSSICVECGPARTPREAIVPIQPIFETIVNGVRDSCPLMPTCSNNDMRRNWAQRRVGADLMMREIRRIGVPDGSVTVSVLDTGFDRYGNQKYLSSPKFQAYRAGEDTQEVQAAMDENGHGTAVAGLVGGGDGIGIAPGQNLVSYKIADVAGRTIESLAPEIERACTTHPDILNLSSTSFAARSSRFLFFRTFELTGGDELLGDVEWETTRKSTLDYLTKNGCLLVQNAGNHGLRDQKSKHNPDNAVLRVEATSAFSQPGESTSFSSTGEIRAPGQDVYTLHSKGFPNLVDGNWTPGSRMPEGLQGCNDQPGFFETGTSFAAPIVSGIAAQVKAVLTRSTEFTKMDATSRIALINRVLFASIYNDSVNAYRAVLIAERWVNATRITPKKLLPSADALTNTLREIPPAQCAQPPKFCSAVAGCIDRRACIREARAYLYGCDRSEPAKRADFLNDLITTAQKSDDLELMAEWINALHAIDREKALARARTLNLYAESVLVRSSVGGLSRAIAFMQYQRQLTGGMDDRARRKIQEVSRQHLLTKNDGRAAYQNKIDLCEHLFSLGVVDTDFILGLTSDSKLLEFDDATRLMILHYSLNQSEKRLSNAARFAIVQKLIGAPRLSSRFISEAIHLLNRAEAFKFVEKQRLELYEKILAAPALSPEALTALADVKRSDDDPDAYEAFVLSVLKSPKHDPQSLKNTITSILQIGRGRYFATAKIDEYGRTRASSGSWVPAGDYQILAKGADPSNSSLIAELALAEFKGRLSQVGATLDYAHYRRAVVKILFESFEVARGLEKYLRSGGLTPEVQMAVAQGFGMTRAPTPAAEESLSLVLAVKEISEETFRSAAIAIVSAQGVKRLNEFLDTVSAHPQMSETVMDAMLISLLARKASPDDPAIRALFQKKMISAGVLARLQKQVNDPEDQKLAREWSQKLYPQSGI